MFYRLWLVAFTARLPTNFLRVSKSKSSRLICKIFSFNLFFVKHQKTKSETSKSENWNRSVPDVRHFSIAYVRMEIEFVRKVGITLLCQSVDDRFFDLIDTVNLRHRKQLFKTFHSFKNAMCNILGPVIELCVDTILC